MVADVKEFCKRVTSAKEQTGIFMYCMMLFYAYVHVRRIFEKTSAELHPSILYVRGGVYGPPCIYRSVLI